MAYKQFLVAPWCVRQDTRLQLQMVMQRGAGNLDINSCCVFSSSNSCCVFSSS